MTISHQHHNDQPVFIIYSALFSVRAKRVHICICDGAVFCPWHDRHIHFVNWAFNNSFLVVVRASQNRRHFIAQNGVFVPELMSINIYTMVWLTVNDCVWMGSNEQLVSLRVVKQNPQNEIDNKKMLTPLPDRTKHRACANACRVFRPLYNCIASNFRQSIRVCISHKSTPARRKQFSQFYLCASVWKSGDAVNITRGAISLARSKRKSPHLSLEKSSCQDRRTMPRRTNIQYTHTHTCTLVRRYGRRSVYTSSRRCATCMDDIAGGAGACLAENVRAGCLNRWYMRHKPPISRRCHRVLQRSAVICVCVFSWRLPSANVPYSIITSLYTTRHTRSTCLL